MKRVLAIDPGSEKCGMAVVTEDDVLVRAVHPRHAVVRIARDLAAQYSVDAIVVGNGTGSSKLTDELRASLSSIPLRVVDESGTTLRARAKFFEENPPRGFLRFIPRGLLIPPRPYDDFVAQILAERYLCEHQE
jgi:Predicted endonuclease involved in recombination (possible Holliday junction resolvase in Mycoplasmas and B. subtilis)